MERIGRREFLFGIGVGILGLGLQNICEAEGPKADLGFLALEDGSKGHKLVAAGPVNKSSKKRRSDEDKERRDEKTRLKKIDSITEKNFEKHSALEPLVKGIYLTIDDAPSDYMPLILSNLGKNNVVFFVYGEQVYPRRRYMIAQALASGNILGNHSFLHHHYSGMSLDEIKNDVDKTDKLIEQLYKEAGLPRRHKLIRFPYIDPGYYLDEKGVLRGSLQKEEQVLAFVKNEGYKVMPYSCNSLDFMTQERAKAISADAVVANCRRACDGDIVLCHCIFVTAEKVVPYFVDNNAYQLLLPEPNVRI